MLTNDIVIYEELGPGGQMFNVPNFRSQGPNPAEGRIQLITIPYSALLHSSFHYCLSIVRIYKEC